MAFSRHQALISVLMFHPRDPNFTPCAAARDYVIDLIGSGGGTRTPDTRIMIATLDSDQSPPLASPRTFKTAKAAF